MKLFSIFKNKPIIAKPTTSKAEVLFELIVKGSVSQKQFGYMGGYRAHISSLILDYSVKLDKERKTALNKHKNQYTYMVHTLSKENRTQAIEVYNKINECKLPSRIFDKDGKALGTTNT